MNCSPSSSGERNFLKTQLPALIGNNNPILMDAGANVGTYTKALHEFFPEATIHSFEPHPATFKKLQSSVGIYATCHNFGLGSKTETVTLHDHHGQNGTTHASLYADNVSGGSSGLSTKTTVQLRSLDEFVADQNISNIDFLKIDTEGHDLEVLKGATTTLNAGNISCIQFEFGATHCASRTFMTDFSHTLSGYQLFRLLPNGMLHLNLPVLETEIFGFQNIVAIQRDKV